MSGVVNLEELCDEVNRVLDVRGISVADGRTASVITPRNVRYYQTIGLLQPPIRREGRAVYRQLHIDAIIAIKQAQHHGISLEQLLGLLKKRETSDKEFVSKLNNTMNTVVQASNLLNFSHAEVFNIKSSKSDEVFGWSIHLSGIVLSGHETPPTHQQINAIQKVLETDTPCPGPRLSVHLL